MPAFGGGDDDSALLLNTERGDRFRLGLRQRVLLDGLPLAVEAVELGGDFGRLDRISSISSFTPRSARPMRPPALMRGPSRKPECQASGGR